MSGSNYTLYHGDCLEILPTLEAGSVDAIICDPPSGIGFMGAEWDKDKGGREAWIAWLAEVLTHARRVLKAGGYALIWALPRTSHWTATAIEDAGLIVQDRITHAFGQGLPKNKTHLKPAVEDWYLAYKRGGKRFLNIEGCRMATDEDLGRTNGISSLFGGGNTGESTQYGKPISDQGRYPPHLILSHAPDCTPAACGVGCPVRLIGEQSGVSVSNGGKTPRVGMFMKSDNMQQTGNRGGVGDTGTAARFFPQFPAATGEYAPIRYEGKASRADREWGTEGLDKKPYGSIQGHLDGSLLTGSGNKRNNHARNHHPTVKSTELMQWLVRLVTNTHDTVLDMFMGSGTTGIAAIREARRFIGIEKDPAYFAIAEKRITTAANNRQMTLEEML